MYIFLSSTTYRILMFIIYYFLMLYVYPGVCGKFCGLRCQNILLVRNLMIFVKSTSIGTIQKVLRTSNFTTLSPPPPPSPCTLSSSPPPPYVCNNFSKFSGPFLTYTASPYNYGHERHLQTLINANRVHLQWLHY